MNDRWQQLRARWAEHGVRTVPPATEAELTEFETHHGVVLPEDLRAYFAALGGMDPHAMPAYDREGFAIWPLSEVRPSETDRSLFVIADYLNWSWAYAITLSSNGAPPHPVVMLAATIPQPVASSFTEFIDLYLSNSRLLYPLP